MEPTDTPPREKLKINYVVHTKVAKLEEIKTIVSGKKDAQGNASLEIESQGWHVLFEGSREMLYIGAEKPDLEVGDDMKITFEKVT